MEDMDSRLNALLSDPEAMGRIMALAQQLSGESAASSPPPSPEPPPSSQQEEDGFDPFNEIVKDFVSELESSSTISIEQRLAPRQYAILFSSASFSSVALPNTELEFMYFLSTKLSRQ